MGRYVTPAGVVIEMADKAALAVGYKAETVEATGAEKPKPEQKPRRTKK